MARRALRSIGPGLQGARHVTGTGSIFFCAGDRFRGRGPHRHRLSGYDSASGEFRALATGVARRGVAAVPLIVLAAPFIIMRNTIRGREIEGRPFQMVMIATIIAGIWSLMSGTVVVMALNTLCVPASA